MAGVLFFFEKTLKKRKPSQRELCYSNEQQTIIGLPTLRYVCFVQRKTEGASMNEGYSVSTTAIFSRY